MKSNFEMTPIPDAPRRARSKHSTCRAILRRAATGKLADICILIRLVILGSILPTVAVAQADSSSPIRVEFVKLIPSLLWIALVIVLLIRFRDLVDEAASAVKKRLQSGGALEIWWLKLPALPSPTPGIPERKIGNTTITVDQDREKKRDEIYDSRRRVMLTYDTSRSEIKGQSHDVVLFVVGHHTDISIVEHVEYFLGKYLNYGVFTSSDPGINFAVRISTYGSALALARVRFKDGYVSESEIYIRIDNEIREAV